MNESEIFAFSSGCFDGFRLAEQINKKHKLDEKENDKLETIYRFGHAQQFEKTIKLYSDNVKKQKQEKMEKELKDSPLVYIQGDTDYNYVFAAKDDLVAQHDRRIQLIPPSHENYKTCDCHVCKHYCAIRHVEETHGVVLVSVCLSFKFDELEEFKYIPREYIFQRTYMLKMGLIEQLIPK